MILYKGEWEDIYLQTVVVEHPEVFKSPNGILMIPHNPHKGVVSQRQIFLNSCKNKQQCEEDLMKFAISYIKQLTAGTGDQTFSFKDLKSIFKECSKKINGNPLAFIFVLLKIFKTKQYKTQCRENFSYFADMIKKLTKSGKNKTNLYHYLGDLRFLGTQTPEGAKLHLARSLKYFVRGAVDKKKNRSSPGSNMNKLLQIFEKQQPTIPLKFLHFLKTE